MSSVRLVALVSTYREGGLALAAVASVAPHVDGVLVLDGPFGLEPPEGGDPSDWRRLPGNAVVRHGDQPWLDDAAKRTAHAEWARQSRWWREKNGELPLWGLIVDGDEILVNGEHVRAWCERARSEDRCLALRITEWDGTVMRTFHRLVRLDLLARYHLGAHQLEWKDSTVVFTYPNYPEWSPDPQVSAQAAEVRAAGLLQPPFRQPLQGEPHIHHRPYLRQDDRFANRASDAEAEWAREQAARIGA